MLFGGYGWLIRRGAKRDAVAVGIGVVLLAITRPWEGLLASLPVGLALLWRAWRGAGSGALARI